VRRGHREAGGRSPRVREETGYSRTLASGQRRAGSGSEAYLGFPQSGPVKGGKVAKYTFVSPAGRGGWRLPRRLVPSGGSPRHQRPWAGCAPVGGIPAPGLEIRLVWGPNPWAACASSPLGSFRVRVVPPGLAEGGRSGAWMSGKTALDFLRVWDF
jgi:hypothetical protein